MPRVLIAALTLRDVEGPFRDVFREADFSVVFPRRPVQLSEEELLAELAGCDAVLAGSEPYTRQVFASHPQLKVVARNGVGTDAVDLQAATDHGVPVLIAPGNADGVAEHTFALILALAKHVVSEHNAIVAGGWPRKSNQALRGKTLALAGLGRIGKAVAVRGRAFGMNVIAYDPAADADFAEAHNIALTTLEDVFRQGDYVSLHLPLTAATRYRIGRSQFELMKPSACLINTARGALLREDDLVETLRTYRIAGAGLDVLEHEPPPANHPILRLPNVVLTAHTAGVDERSAQDMALMAAKGIVAVCRGGWPTDWVVNTVARK